MGDALKKRVRRELLEMSRLLGRPEHGLAILSEGNTSAKCSEETFFVKASGCALQTLEPGNLVEMHTARIAAMLDKHADDAEIARDLLDARVDPAAAKPSVETTFHGWLLLQPEVDFVGHTHPLRVNQILCTKQAAAFAARRRFPDEVVCCGAASLVIDYADPGVPLARAIRTGWQDFVRRTGCAPRLLLLRNHGMIAVGPTARAVVATTLMAEKAAAVFAGGCAAGKPVHLPEPEVRRIATRRDEHYRQRLLERT